MADESLVLIANVLIKKYGIDKIEKLLSDELTIDINVGKLTANRKAYIRDLKYLKTPFTESHGHEIDADLLLIALDDAREALNYSNWAGDKFDRCGEVICRYCEEHKIPITFRTREG